MKSFVFTKSILIGLLFTSFSVLPAVAQNKIVLKLSTGDCVNRNSAISYIMTFLPPSDSVLTIVAQEHDSKPFIKRYVEEFIGIENHQLVQNNDFYNKLSQCHGTEICVWNEAESKLLYGCEAVRLTHGDNLKKIKELMGVPEKP